MATENDRRSRDPLVVPLCVRMHNRKLPNIRPSGAFWPEITSEQSSRDPCGGSTGCAHAQPEIAQYSPLYGLFTGSDVIKRHP